MNTARRPAAALIELGAALLAAAGLEPRHARRLADSLVAADLLGHGSHGIRLLPRYLDELRDGQMTASGEPELVNDNGASLLFDGRMLPGPVVVAHAAELALRRLETHGAVVAVIRRSSHIAALCTYLELATSRGAMMLIASSNPWARLVAPFGGRRPVYSPNPLAFGAPTSGDPILIDFSTSTIAANVVQTYRMRGEALPGDYLLDGEGRPTRDPGALAGGAILPLGGVDLGHKGFGLGLIVEALTAGLCGYGRSDAPAATNNAVFLLVLQPGAFAGPEFLLRELDGLAGTCRAAGDGVRLPGEGALAHRRQALTEGLALGAPLLADLFKRAAALGVEPPVALGPAPH
jgi:LDH2 family malate/lactate/ureidoglycolate dehydrogenase